MDRTIITTVSLVPFRTAGIQHGDAYTQIIEGNVIIHGAKCAEVRERLAEVPDDTRLLVIELFPITGDSTND